jgi:hypothetical protein
MPGSKANVRFAEANLTEQATYLARLNHLAGAV